MTAEHQRQDDWCEKTVEHNKWKVGWQDPQWNPGSSNEENHDGDVEVFEDVKIEDENLSDFRQHPPRNIIIFNSETVGDWFWCFKLYFWTLLFKS